MQRAELYQISRPVTAQDIQTVLSSYAKFQEAWPLDLIASIKRLINIEIEVPAIISALQKFYSTLENKKSNDYFSAVELYRLCEILLTVPHKNELDFLRPLKQLVTADETFACLQELYALKKYTLENFCITLQWPKEYLVKFKDKIQDEIFLNCLKLLFNGGFFVNPSKGLFSLLSFLNDNQLATLHQILLNLRSHHALFPEAIPFLYQVKKLDMYQIGLLFTQLKIYVWDGLDKNFSEYHEGDYLSELIHFENQEQAQACSDMLLLFFTAIANEKLVNIFYQLLGLEATRFNKILAIQYGRQFQPGKFFIGLIQGHLLNQNNYMRLLSPHVLEKIRMIKVTKDNIHTYFSFFDLIVLMSTCLPPVIVLDWNKLESFLNSYANWFGEKFFEVKNQAEQEALITGVLCLHDGDCLNRERFNFLWNNQGRWGDEKTKLARMELIEKFIKHNMLTMQALDIVSCCFEPEKVLAELQKSADPKKTLDLFVATSDTIEKSRIINQMSRYYNLHGLFIPSDIQAKIAAHTSSLPYEEAEEIAKRNLNKPQ